MENMVVMATVWLPVAGTFITRSLQDYISRRHLSIKTRRTGGRVLGLRHPSVFGARVLYGTRYRVLDETPKVDNK